MNGGQPYQNAAAFVDVGNKLWQISSYRGIIYTKIGSVPWYNLYHGMICTII